jgi:hypothetical protein
MMPHNWQDVYLHCPCCHCRAACLLSDAGFMSKAARPVRRITRNLLAILTDWAYAQRKLTELRLAPEQYVYKRNAVPQTYAEFLYRTSGVLHHEPPARVRIHS